MRLQGKYDRRYRLVERPVIIVGGELNMDALDLIWSEESRFYEAPIQMKANGGALMIDDFGRQRIDPKTLLNRWIVPLEKQIDFLTLHTGTKIEIPFDQLIVFSTNLNPRDPGGRCVPAPYPLQDSDQRSDARELSRDLAHRQRGRAPCPTRMRSSIILSRSTCARSAARCVAASRATSSRTFIDVCRYRQFEPTVTAEMLDDAAEAYFVKFDDKNYSSIR